ncbi:iron-sulfur cluster carrier protein ApbC [Rickettsiella endosymbiont of Miltochrista miniata]|uniref:iron-sulfur cluster carrier protein ApbC n=1 Tax=Rickettsiella endosymbiont of Miltochrista miniata TaxID=3066239 RepID=UPI00313EDF92
MLKITDRVKHIIAVASGKGGVGKSTTAVNLALALAEKKGVRVGILDADIYGPNQPQMLGVSEKPTSKDGKTLEPVYAHGLQSMSIGYLIDVNTPMIWRGPMATGALQQLLNDTHWDNLDYLIVDLPPGTGDIQLTLTQKIPLAGAVIVTTPQDIALLDVRKAIGMFNKVKVPLLGVVENMCTHVCKKCGHGESIFGDGGGERIAKECNITLLGVLPLDSRIRKQADSGKPIFLAEPQSAIADIYRGIANKIADQLRNSKTKAFRFPKIVIEKQ